jgi:hypothetical protein
LFSHFFPAGYESWGEVCEVLIIALTQANGENTRTFDTKESLLTTERLRMIEAKWKKTGLRKKGTMRHQLLIGRNKIDLERYSCELRDQDK